MILVNNQSIKDIDGIALVQYNGEVLWRKKYFSAIVVVGDDNIGVISSVNGGRTWRNGPQPEGGYMAAGIVGSRNHNWWIHLVGAGGMIEKTFVDPISGTGAGYVECGKFSSLDYIDFCAGDDTVVILAEGNVCTVGRMEEVGRVGGNIDWYDPVEMPGDNLGPVAYGNGVFVAPSGDYGGTGAYSTDGGLTWHETSVWAPKEKPAELYVPKVRPCRNICWGDGVFFCSSGMTDASGDHYEYSYSYDGIEWHVVSTGSMGEGRRFCNTTQAFFSRGVFYAVDGGNVYRVPASAIEDGPLDKVVLTGMTGTKHGAFALDDYVILAECRHKYGADSLFPSSKIAIYKGGVSDETCVCTSTPGYQGTIRQVVAI